MEDITQMLYSEDLIKQIFKKQKIFSNKFLKILIRDIVLCSIMKLNDVSGLFSNLWKNCLI